MSVEKRCLSYLAGTFTCGASTHPVCVTSIGDAHGRGLERFASPLSSSRNGVSMSSVPSPIQADSKDPRLSCTRQRCLVVRIVHVGLPLAWRARPEGEELCLLEESHAGLYSVDRASGTRVAATPYECCFDELALSGGH